jgi:anti-anti-sigma regulatory factor
MTTSHGKVLARQEADELCFLVIGQITCHHCLGLRQFAEEGLARGATRIQVDLRDCTYGDSTFLGTLLQLQRRCGGETRDAFRLVSPSAQFRQMLVQIGAERLFRIVDHVPTTDMQTTWQQLNDNVVRSGSLRFKQNVVEAHQELANAGGALGQRFGPLAEAVSRELDVQPTERPKPSPSPQ